MRTAVFSTHAYDREFLEPAAQKTGHELVFFEARLTPQTVPLAAGFPAICSFVNDSLSREILTTLAAGGTKFIALRCAGFNQVDLAAAAELEIRVARVPAYSPYSVAEHTVALMLALNRKLHRAYTRVRDSNFALDGLLGFDFHGRTVGVIGTGKIGLCTAKILAGFGCELLFYDVYQNPEAATLGRYVPLEQLLTASDIITLHCPLTPDTYHLIGDATLAKMKPGVMIVNTSRGALVDTRAAIEALKSGQIGYLGLDVYEEEADLFFRDLSGVVIQDDQFSRLLTFPNVLVTAHQAFFTRNALTEIARVTMANLTAAEQGETLVNEVMVPR
ncbi:D-isomer specific 2-hydroxyacid dehydrogenase NAD-binding protein [Pirellula staleyi DSM 6068]|uniref:D-isomer specific 2-hydroxyacid dehydrogenase NAD-binding protein n=1 Tax=Pirellula staleyi (strain ATCC 27377 / DSM 6068 / ICPB 4128) TaxID=530564 RepID=D2QXG9_PIRSD|nr:2-hydroxyacid dehydrogenase [Pirellula staleyi]ADB16154.1 D-isomer specific 2-hydroxyacid dehydrogenase NAD-binding protein [Pirellula staleyi DSM 6068]